MAERHPILIGSVVVVGLLSLALSACGGSTPISSKSTVATTAATTPAATTASPATASPTTASPTTPATTSPTTAATTTTTTTPKKPKKAKKKKKSTTTTGPGAAPASLSAALKVKGPGPFRIPAGKSPNTWPEVCDMLSGREIIALDPSEITGIHGKPVGTKAEILGGSGGNTKHDTQCRWNVTTHFKSPAGNPSYVEISLQEVDSLAAAVWKEDNKSEKKASAKYPGQYADYASLPGGTKCFYDGTELECLKGDVYFYVGGELSQEYTYNQKPWLLHALLPIAVKVGSVLGG
jgi:hypothetical protein